MLFIRLTSQNFPIKHQYTLLKARVFSNVVSIAAEILLPPPNKSTYSQRTHNNLMMQGQDWKQQHCVSRICDGLCSAHTCVWLSTVIQEQQFIYFSCGMNSLKVGIQIYQSFSILIRVQFCPLGQEVHTNNIFLIPRDCNHNVSDRKHTGEFLLPWDAI